MEKPAITPQLYQFKGGIKLDLHHDESTGKPIKPLPLANKFIVPIQQHIGQSAIVRVTPGDYVFKGQTIAQASSERSSSIHAPTSGTVVEIKPHSIPHPSGLSASCIFIEPDEQDRWYERDLSCEKYQSVNPKQLLQRIYDAGIVGLGGATFPTAAKLNARPNDPELLLINAAECEPYISCDDALMRQYANKIILGIDIIRHCKNTEKCIIAIEDNTIKAFYALQKAINELQIINIDICVIPTIYPIGGERQLIQVVTGKEVPSGKLPQDIGIICHNVATAAAIYDAVIEGTPLISRIVTVTGAIQDARNLEVRIGTPISNLIEFCGGITDEAQHLIMGGPMMGFALPNDKLPVTKATNCLFVSTVNPEQDQLPCIRCGLCEQVCPASLLPQQLFWYSQAKDFDSAKEYNLFDCIECGCCAYVCPSNIPLVQYYRHAKNELKIIDFKKQKAAVAKHHFENRNNRLEQKKNKQLKKQKTKREIMASNNTAAKKAEIEAALARAKNKKP